MSEHAEQVALFQWAELRKSVYPELIFLFAIPNGAKLPYSRNARGQRYCKQGVYLKAEGLRSGVPDICLPVPRGQHHGLFIELKAGDNTASENQERWLEALNGFGYLAVLAWGWQEASELIQGYLEERI